MNEPFPDDDDDEATERQMREIATRNYDSLSETESYMWGLGIAGVVHQWERDTRVVIAALSEKPLTFEKLEKMDFRELCKQVGKTGFDIEQHKALSALRCAHLIANTIKHGAGKSFRDLAAEKPDLFPGGPTEVRDRTQPPAPHHLRVSAPQFDEAVRAIDEIWEAYENAALGAK